MDKEKTYLKEKIRTLSRECEDKKQLVEVMTRVELQLKDQIQEREAECKQMRKQFEEKERKLGDNEDFIKKSSKRIEELKDIVKENRGEIEKMRRQEEASLRRTIDAQQRTEQLKAQLKHKDTQVYIPTIQKLSRLEQEANEMDVKANKAEERFVQLQEDVKSLKGQMAILNQAALKMAYESKSKDEKIAQLEKEIEAKRKERYDSEANIDQLKGKLVELYFNMDQLEREKERFNLNFE